MVKAQVRHAAPWGEKLSRAEMMRTQVSCNTSSACAASLAQQPLDEAEQPALVARIKHIERSAVALRVGQHQLVVGHGVALGGGFGGRGAGERRHRRIFTRACTDGGLLRG